MITNIFLLILAEFGLRGGHERQGLKSAEGLKTTKKDYEQDQKLSARPHALRYKRRIEDYGGTLFLLAGCILGHII